MLSKIKGLIKFNGFKLFSRPYELNIVGLRSKSVIPNVFDDELHVFFKTVKDNWDYHIFKITTDPGTFWLKNPMQPQGTAILAQGQYLNSHSIGKHRGQYTALVQTKPLTVVRDYDRDAVLDFYNGEKTTGQYGINIHRANKVGTTKTVDKNSAGCQVFSNASDFDVFMKLCEQHKSRFGNFFTYTLIDFRSVQRRNLKIAAVTLSAFMGLTAIGYYVINSIENKNQKQLSNG